VAVLRATAVRLLVLVVSLVVASVIVFVLCALLPGDVAQVMLGQNADPATVAALRERLGTDRPATVRYLDWAGGLLRGDLGRSYLTGDPVAGQVAARLPVTLWLVGWGMLLAVLVAVPVGMLAAVRRRRLSGVIISGASQLGLAVPAFWAGILLVLVFAVRLRWFPANGT